MPAADYKAWISQVHKKKRKGKGNEEQKISYPFDYNDSLLCGLVSNDVEYVMTTDDTVLHLSITPNVWIISLNPTYGTSDLCRLHSRHTEGIYKWQWVQKKRKVHSCLKVFYKSMQQREKRPPTVGEARRAVVHVGEADADCGGSWKAAHLSGHVFSLDHNLVVLFDFSVHARQGCLDQAWGKISRFMVSLF